MASSKSSESRKGCRYDVFVSLEKDTRYNFVHHLHVALIQSKMLVFNDHKILWGGKEIPPEHLEAIRGSRCVVVVLSKNYVHSSWCLAELAKIMECHNRMGQLVIPVFYYVDPSDVRIQKRDFETAFRQNKEKCLEEINEVNEWREALTAVSKLSGYHISETVEEGEFTIINKIVQNILDHIQPRVMENNLIGIDTRINELKSLLDLEAIEDVRMVGICGMGGIGKTTIAQALFGTISYEFEGSSFVQGVRENIKRGTCALQAKILKDITHHEYLIEDPKHGAEFIKTKLLNRKILLVLDDVDDVDQLEVLPAKHEWFSAGSRIIITTRDEHLLSDADAIYKPRTLPKEQAIELFSRHAFRENNPPEGYDELSDRAICYTSGLPLALKVLGSFFHGKHTHVWGSALNRLAERADRKIFETLKISFDGLSDYDKKIFLDIACFFKGHDEEHVSRVLDSFGFHPVMRFNVLIKKSLITISNNRLDMHDMLQEMGLEFVCESYLNSRLWQCKEIHDIITKNKKLEAVEAIVWSHINADENMDFSDDVFEKMKNIWLLDICGGFTSDKPTTLPDELRWLRWHAYQFSSLPVANMDKLVGLELSDGFIQYLWMGYKIMPYLKFLHLEGLGGLERFPDVSGAPNVERLILSNCWNLVEVHNSLGTLKKLAYLNMNGCWNLKYLPPLIEMPLLETLDLSNCHELETFPEVSSGMEKLSNIYLNACSNLRNIPNSICELNGLKSLHLRNCPKLQKLPEQLGCMPKFKELWLGLRKHIKAFPWQSDSINFRTMTMLYFLRKLDLSWRPIEDKDFPNNEYRLSFLEELHLSGNSKLVRLPASISHLSSLKHLELNDCQQLQTIEALPSGIQVLKAGNCRALKKIEDLTEKYVWLHKIFLSGCERLLENQENERYLDKMLQQSFLKKCVAVDHVLSIAIPGSKILSWFEEQRHGNQIALNLPPKYHTDIMGFVVCGVLQGEWQRAYVQGTIEIYFRIGISNTTVVRESKVDCINAFGSAWNESVWIVYIPFSFFQQQQTNNDFKRKDWFVFDNGNLIINMFKARDGHEKIVRSGAHLVYKEDVEPIQQTITRIPDYRNSNIFSRSDGSFVYIEKHMSVDL